MSTIANYAHLCNLFEAPAISYGLVRSYAYRIFPAAYVTCRNLSINAYTTRRSNRLKGMPVEVNSADQFRILTVAQVADRLDVNIQVVYRMIYRGDLPTLRIGNGHRIREVDLLAWLSSAR